ncbi:bifunctional DNA primase/polymerase [Kitasatospora sp. NPDC085895]|uniref:bifunctional DNA primase/polymerase n=1 Tax=Kitasatospora sp. NPDC085895 TaxID=3155057 RepID=UPI00344BF975
MALWCAEQGWPVHPLTPGSKLPAGNCAACSSPGHTAEGCPCLTAGRWCHGFFAATTDPALIRTWWTKNPRFGVGIACGPAGLVVIDVDAHPAPVPSRDRLLPGIPIDDHVDLTGLANGFHTLGLLAALRGAPSPADDTATLRVRTPSGGLHIWYRAHPHLPLRSSTGSGKNRALAWQVDIRARGGYIIAPGTTTPAGTYIALGTSRSPAPLPNWLAQDLLRTHHAEELHSPTAAATMPPPRARQAVIAAGGATSVPKALHTVLAEVAACAAAPEGMGFTEKLNRAAFTAGGLVAAGRLRPHEAESLLRETATTARPHQDRRCESIIRTGLEAGARRPLHPQGRA